MNVLSSRRRQLTVLGAALLLPLLALALFSPWYQTNDDVAMRLLAEGHFVPGGRPLPFLMHVNIIIGKILSVAYTALPQLPWYDLLMGASLTAAAVALLSAWIGAGRWSETVFALLFALFFLFPSFVSVQFSLAGLGCAAAGVTLLVRACSEPLSRRSFRVHLLAGAGLIAWGALIRFEGAVLMILEGALLALPLVIGAWRHEEERPRLRGVALAGAAACVLVVATFAVNQYVYARSPGWGEFYEYNLRRTRINEYAAPERINAEAVETLPARVGWSGNDFALFRNWFFADPDLYSLDRVRRAEAIFYGASEKPTEESRAARIRRGVELAKVFFVEMRLAFLLMLACVLMRGSGARLFLYLIGVASTLAGLIAGMSLALKAPPDRIFWPMLLLAASMLLVASRRWQRPAHPAMVLAASVVAICVAGSAFPVLWKENEVRRAASARARRDAAGLRRTGAVLFVLHGHAFPYEDYWRPLQVERVPFPFVALGVSARTPPVQDSLRRTGRTDLPLSLCTQPGLVIVAPAYITGMLKTFMAEHHKFDVRFDPAFEGEYFTAWKCTRAAAIQR
jgi:hypothetical protein